MSEASKLGVDGCPTENVLAAQCDGVLSSDEAARIGSHIDECESCRQVMIALRARPSSDPLATTRPDHGDTLPHDKDAPDLPTGLLERYQIKRQLGAGGMGVVYEAIDLNLHRVVALKVLRSLGDTTMNRTEAANRLVREARAMAVLSHRHVVTVYDVGINEGQVFVAMQLVDGSTLRDYARAPGRTVSQILRVVCDAGSGLAAAHAAGLIHRDFKPDNVLVSKKGTARVTDFGLARRGGIDTELATDERDSHPRVDLRDAHVTRSGAILGTPAYMAPEQSGGKPCDARADQFSFCVTAWEALFGERPFRGATWSEIYANVIAGAITEPPSTTRVPRLIQRALRRGMATDPDKRFLNMPDLLEILETGVARPTPWKRFAAIGLASAAVAGVAVWIAMPRGAQPAEQRPAVVTKLPAATATPTVVPLEHAAEPAAPPPSPAVQPPPPATSGSRPHHHSVKSDLPPAKAPVPPAPPVPSPVDEARGQRTALDAELRRRGIRQSDLAEPVQAEITAADSALAAGDATTATAKLGDAKLAIATITIDRGFVDRKLERLNRRLHGGGHTEELKPLYKQFAELVQAAKYAEANALLNEMADRFGR